MIKVYKIGQYTTKHVGLILMLAFLSAFLLNGCETTSHGQQGEVLGGVLGGVLSAQVGDGRGKTTSWVNPDTGYQYTVTPTRAYEQNSGPCREFQLDATVGGERNQNVYGTACYQADGSWLVR